MKNVRAAAAQVLYAVIFDGYSLSDCLPATLMKFEESRDQALIQAICYGVCRRYYYFEYLLSLLLDRPLSEMDKDIFCLLLVGLYQLADMRIPAYAAVDDTVAATKELDKVWAKGLVNAVLRNYQRRELELQEKIKQNLPAHYAHPEWFVGMLKKAWPTEVEAIMEANNQHPPLALRVNQRKYSREDYIAKLAASDISAFPIPETAFGVILEKPMDVKQLPGFLEGEASVQDGAAQLAADLLDLQAGMRVLDACAAPGGKTAHIAEQEPNLAELVAIDHDEARLQAVRDNLERLQLQATCVHSDVAAVKAWWDGQTFDRILLDAPCSASGVIRRHPDIKLLRRPDDIQSLVKEQLRLLTALWPCLKAGGLLVYATCSLFPRENSGVLTQFLLEHLDAEEEVINKAWGRACPTGRQILPGEQGMDGFYYALLRKKA